MTYRAERHQLLLSINDNGCGFDLAYKEGSASLSKTTKHLGLATMQKRIEKLGGTFQLVSTPEEGTKVSLYLPVVATQPIKVKLISD